VAEVLNVIAEPTTALDTLEDGVAGADGAEFWEMVTVLPADQADSAPTLSRACAFTTYWPASGQLRDWLAAPQTE
jgi:hypothetical protein